MRLNTKNMARTTLTKDIGATDTSFTVADANVLPDPPFRMTVENEIMEVGAKNVSTKTLSGVLRGQEGTTATAHANGSIVENRFTAGTYDEIKQTMGPLASLITRIKTSIVNALNGLQEDFNSHKADYVLQVPYGVTTGSANTYAVTLDPAPSAYTDGMALAIKINVDNTGASTINVNGLGAKSIKKSNGNNVSSGNLKAGSIYTLRYNGTNFILQGEGGEYGTAQAGDVLSGKTIGTEQGIVSGTMPNRGAVVITPGTSNKAIQAGYHNGSGYVKSDANLVAGNIKSGVNIFGVAGSLIPYSSVWTQRTSSFGSTYINDVAYGNNMFVAVGESGKLATSTDGITWTQRTSSFGSTYIQGVAYGNNMFVAVGYDGKLATSTDGITWTQRTSSFGSTYIQGVAYGNNMFVAVGDGGKLATSTDGIIWAQHTSSFDTANIRGVAYGNNMFVAGGRSGRLATLS